jgi:lysophospholipase L1-like esterase
MRRPSSDTGYFEIYAYGDGQATLAMVAGLGSGGLLHYWNGAYVNTSTSYSTDTWYYVTLEFDVAADKYNYTVYDTSYNEVLRVNDISFGGAITNGIDRIKIRTSTDFNNIAYLDDVIVRKSAGAEPSVSFGSESNVIFKEAWSIVTKAISSNAGDTIRWRVYANDTSGNWAASDIYSFVTETDNTAPVITDFYQYPTTVNAGEQINATCIVSDAQTPANELAVTIEYKKNTSSTWLSASPVYGGATRQLIYTIGDSITAGHPGYDPNPSSGNIQSSYQYWLDSYMNSNTSSVVGGIGIYNLGVGGNTCDQVAARFGSVPANAAYVLILCGINDIAQHHAADEIKEDIYTLYNMSLAKNVTPILMTIMPDSVQSYCVNTTSVNTWLRTFTTEKGAILVDLYPYFYTGTDCYTNTSLFADDVHPNVVGYNLMGKIIWEQAFNQTYYSDTAGWQASIPVPTNEFTSDYDFRCNVSDGMFAATATDLHTVHVNGFPSTLTLNSPVDGYAIKSGDTVVFSYTPIISDTIQECRLYFNTTNTQVQKQDTYKTDDGTSDAVLRNENAGRIFTKAFKNVTIPGPADLTVEIVYALESGHTIMPIQLCNADPANYHECNASSQVLTHTFNLTGLSDGTLLRHTFTNIQQNLTSGPIVLRVMDTGGTYWAFKTKITSDNTSQVSSWYYTGSAWLDETTAWRNLIRFYVNYSSGTGGLGWGIKQTSTTITNNASNTFTVNNIASNTLWNVECIDGHSGSIFAAANRSIIIASNHAPTASLIAPTIGIANVELQVDGNGSTDPDNDTLAFSWSFGDTTYSSLARPLHTYLSEGFYTINLTATDPYGLSDSKIALIEILPADTPRGAGATLEVTVTS